ncbi:ATP-binding protein, partial [Streptomyces scabiei]|uniref:ATP-binding protein n=1 Tax=Streptomyces scabiei TaxID=1930 RepID=UPI001F1A0422
RDPPTYGIVAVVIRPPENCGIARPTPVAPVPRADRAAVEGRGLLLVDRLTDVWGVEARGGGKCVWCEFLLVGA